MPIGIVCVVLVYIRPGTINNINSYIHLISVFE